MVADTADTPSGEAATSNTVALTPHGTTFATPVTVSVPYSGGATTGLKVFRLDDELDTTWEEVVGANFDGSVATFQTTSFSVIQVTATCPTTELCNGLDDNCNGVVDDSPADAGMSCGASAMGECANGTTVCNSGNLECTPGTPSAEVCNFLDDDCNGVADDGINLDSDPANCGACDNDCGANADCSAATCECLPGWLNRLNLDGFPGCETPA